MRGTRTSIVAAALAVTLTSTAGAAIATSPDPYHDGGRSVTAGESSELATGLLGPLRVAVGRGNTAYVSQNLGGKLTRVDRSGEITTLLDRPGIEIGGVSTRHGEVYFTESSGGPQDPEAPYVANVSVLEDGETRVLADLAALETEYNYDAGNEYGFQGLPAECASRIPADLAPIALPHGGEAYSHPYATAVSDSGRYVYVADAGANAIFTVDTRRGSVDATVLEPVPTLVTAELVASLAEQGFALPECVVGATFNAEPVPTDIEFGPAGLLYLTSLPGTPEAPGSGSVRSFDPRSGDVDVVVAGLNTPTGLAFDRRGNLFIAELFANRILVVPAGTDEAVPFTEAVLPADVEVDGKYLYATTNALPCSPEVVTDPPCDPAPQGALERTRLEYGRK
ncbi:ScyD/ScyE family protein [Arthrobacter ruber]|uniref:ScyD/ScyE family protein n=1 Tax=Arthrobacter ruber TaxID=1258893 RepID=UPI000CF3C133|nr:ScyD/ScyE family protein [Arthrobacter ruber]